MQYIKILLSNIGKEVKYQIYSGVFILMIITLLIFSGLNLYNQKKLIIQNYNLFIHTLNETKKMGMDVEEILKKPLKIEEKNGVKKINNPLKFDYENVALAIYDLKNPNRVITNTLKYLSFIFYSFFFGVYGVYIATYDIKYKTLKIKAVQNNWMHILLSKQLSMYILSFLMIIIVLFLSSIIGFIFYNSLFFDIPVNEFKLSVQPSDTNIILQFVLSVFLSFIFTTFGFYLGLLFRGVIYPILILVLYNFIFPTFGKYDLKNLISILGHKVFDFYGNFILFKPEKISLNVSIILLVTYIIISTLFTYIIVKNQSKYID
ncbi:hypothetical protein Marpi_2112 [Marinitoga piezophila KA3]|uniref:ABC-2 family transporter protein n=1 Tax=Marinitoga piezophila (strain DSM 14283 / JCM 11233 / KA3) TaxID=443254 RepID=H2J7J4_MARPK|nr:MULTISPECIES: ABC transporter permease [Marinitoga]AEX86487.1 hypothetical protein Marpi_2112 [Marinitoga piezophila KA3]APT76871.1 hypothetical protein LN42_11145 [Marinitoga sp. 1137]